MHRTYLADIERGGRNVTLRSIARLAEALQIPAEYLLGRQTEAAAGEILLVEDNEADAELMCRDFKHAKFANPLKVVRDGEAALDYLSGQGKSGRGRAPALPHLVLLDLNLPGISGLEVLRRLRKDPHTKALPVVILTVSRHDRDILECGRLGADNYIIKPVSFDRFRRMMPKLNLQWALVQAASDGGAEAAGDAIDPGI